MLFSVLRRIRLADRNIRPRRRPILQLLRRIRPLRRATVRLVRPIRRPLRGTRRHRRVTVRPLPLTVQRRPVTAQQVRLILPPNIRQRPPRIRPPVPLQLIQIGF